MPDLFSQPAPPFRQPVISVVPACGEAAGVKTFHRRSAVAPGEQFNEIRQQLLSPVQHHLPSAARGTR